MSGTLEDRTMTIARDLDAPVEKVWQAWTDPAILPRWWGPDGFSCDTARIDLRSGGEWVFDMIGPDGTRYPNQHQFLVYEPEARIVYRLNHGAGGAEHATVTVTMSEIAAGRTRLTLRMVFVDQAEHDTAKGFGAEALGLQTLAKCEAAARAA
ncbi:hypothetical protein HKCCE2091_20550 [Rhodobacterales bacterium HKCCE2091]|nr:hypothetical protein [Rhodobacterales bacterium HKCCE2091]